MFYAFAKPAGLAVHPANEDVPDLVSWIRRQRSLPRDLKPAHRLDRATSGVVLCGAGKRARAQLNARLEGAQKTYLALVAGAPKDAAGAFTAPLSDARRGRALAAETRFQVRERFGGFTLLELTLVTGRKHQLRRHLADAGLPVVGDGRYGPRRPRRVPAFPGRLFLHAERIALSERVVVAPLPEALQRCLSGLRSSEGSPPAPG